MLSSPILPILLLLFALLFLGTIGHLVINARALADLFGKRRGEADKGDIVADEHGRRRGASRGAIIVSLALHVIGLAGMVVTVLVMSGVILTGNPRSEAPSETVPAAAAGESGPSG